MDASRCPKCSAAEVDEHKCIYCGLCTAKREFDAIKLSRDMPEESTIWNIYDKLKAILPHMAYRKIKHF